MNDPARTYSVQEVETLNENQLLLLTEIYQGNWIEQDASVRLLCQIHKRIFTGVRGFAGLHRNPNFGSDRVNFYGSLRSPHKDEVPLRLQKILEKVQTCLLEWKGKELQSDYDLACIQLALKTHADLIGLQPFEDGNKRTSRAFMNWLLIRFGLRPIAFEVVQQDYAMCMVTYLETKNLEPLVSLALRLYDI